MPHQGYADPIMNDRPGFHSDMPVSELTEQDTRAIEASVISLAPLIAETVHIKLGRLLPSPTGLGGLSRPTPT